MTDEQVEAATDMLAKMLAPLKLPHDGIRAMAHHTLAAAAEAVAWSHDMGAAPRNKPLLGVVHGRVRVIQWGKTSHVPLYGWCLADQGVEDFDICNPTAWHPLPEPPQ